MLGARNCIRAHNDHTPRAQSRGSKPGARGPARGWDGEQGPGRPRACRPTTPHPRPQVDASCSYTPRRIRTAAGPWATRSESTRRRIPQIGVSDIDSPHESGAKADWTSCPSGQPGRLSATHESSDTIGGSRCAAQVRRRRAPLPVRGGRAETLPHGMSRRPLSSSPHSPPFPPPLATALFLHRHA